MGVIGIYILFVISVILLGLKIHNKLKQKWCESKVCLIGKTVIVTGANTGNGIPQDQLLSNPSIVIKLSKNTSEGAYSTIFFVPTHHNIGIYLDICYKLSLGIGYETALEFAKRGARVILACQNEQRGTAAKDSIIRKTQNENVVVRIVNLASLISVRKFAKHILDTEERLDILVNNAGAGGLDNKMTDDGLQLLMQVNYFGPTLLTMLLIDLLRKSAPSRIINVASLVARYAKLTPDNLNLYPGPVLNYHNSKLGNILFTIRLAELLKKSNVSVFSLHPGGINTEIMRRIPPLVKFFCDLIFRFFFKTPEEGAQTTLHASLEQGIEQYSGRHFEECTLVPTYKTAMDEKLNKTIWDKTMKLINCEKELLKLS